MKSKCVQDFFPIVRESDIIKKRMLLLKSVVIHTAANSHNTNSNYSN